MGIRVSKRDIHEIGTILYRASPFYGCVAAGFPSPATDYIEDTIDLNTLLIKTPSATFFIRVEGESMVNAFIPPKALLIIDRSVAPMSGDIVVAVVDGDFTVKRLVRTLGHVYLAPENVKFTTLEITEEMNFQVWGVVTKIIIDPKDIASCSL